MTAATTAWGYARRVGVSCMYDDGSRMSGAYATMSWGCQLCTMSCRAGVATMTAGRGLTGMRRQVSRHATTASWCRCFVRWVYVCACRFMRATMSGYSLCQCNGCCTMRRDNALVTATACLPHGWRVMAYVSSVMLRATMSYGLWQCMLRAECLRRHHGSAYVMSCMRRTTAQCRYVGYGRVGYDVGARRRVSVMSYVIMGCNGGSMGLRDYAGLC